MQTLIKSGSVWVVLNITIAKGVPMSKRTELKVKNGRFCRIEVEIKDGRLSVCGTEAGLTRCVICYRLFFLDCELASAWEIPCCNACATKARESVS